MKKQYLPTAAVDTTKYDYWRQVYKMNMKKKVFNQLEIWKYYPYLCSP